MGQQKRAELMSERISPQGTFLLLWPRLEQLTLKMLMCRCTSAEDNGVAVAISLGGWGGGGVS